MKLAFSNIAWLAEEEESILPILKDYGVRGIEIAPTKYWHNFLEATPDDILIKKEFLNASGFEVPAAQALLYGHPEFTIFTDVESRNRTLNYLVQVGRLCSRMGIGVLVFGSPANRRRNSLSKESATDIAADFFFTLAEKISLFEMKICIEPNPVEYGCDFINTTKEAMELVKLVNHRNFRLHLDTSAMTLNGEDPLKIIPAVIPWTAHIHISEPNLSLIGSGATNHKKVAEALLSNGYNGWISLEMRSGLLPDNLEAVKCALDFTRTVYFT
jgi:D-psicose/D-tagatose/L-ribulose 3-epimerase